MNFSTGTHGIHVVLIQLVCGTVTETIVYVCAETAVVVLVALVGNILDKYRRIEINQRSGNTLSAVVGEVDRSKRTVGTVAAAYHSHTPPSSGVGIQPIGFLTGLAILYLDKVGGVHSIPLSVDKPREYRALVTPLAEIFHGGRPHAYVVAAITRISYVMRPDYISTVFTGIIGVLKHTGLSVGKVFPQREIGILRAYGACRKSQKRGYKKLFHHITIFSLFINSL